MEGRGSLRQLHQQLAEASYGPSVPLANPYSSAATAQDWQQGAGYEKRSAPPLPTLPPWALNPLGSSSQHPQYPQHQPQYQQQKFHHQQQHFSPIALSSTLTTQYYSRDEIDPASAGAQSEQDSGTTGWRKAPSYFGSMKRLPLNNSVDQGHPQVPLRQQQSPQQLPGFPMKPLGDELPSASVHKEQLFTQEPFAADQAFRSQPSKHHQRSVRNQQQEADEPRDLTAIAPASPSHHQQPSSKPDEPQAIDQTFSEPVDSTTNQADEENASSRKLHRFLDADSSASGGAFTTVMVQQNGFFRPWKKNSLLDDDDNNNSEGCEGPGEASCGGSSQVNKWKVRALLNPFAKREKTASRSVANTNFNNSEPNYDGDDEPVPPPKPSSSSAISGAPRRPTTPVPAPSTLSLASVRPPSGLRSRGQIHDQEPAIGESDCDDKSSLVKTKAPPPFRRNAKVLTPLQDASSQPQPQIQAPRDNYYNREEREDFQSFKAPVKQPKSQPAVARDLRPQAQQQSQQPQQHVTRETKQQHAAAAKAKTKSSVLGALAEIQRKRDERRAQQAEEKQRIQTELEEYGDDAGYKFRRLIQKYRDALPAFQKQQKTAATALPPLTKSAGASNPATSTTRLSVFVRKRPLSKKEFKAKGYDIISCLYLFAAAATAGKAKLSAVVVPASSHRQELILHEPKLKVDCSKSLEHHQFRFDGVFDELQDNAQVYACSVGPLIPYLIHDRVLETRSGAHSNLTVFAYGQTGSGKTFTMKSIYRQAASDLFERIEVCCGAAGHQVPSPVLVGVSFYEIYMNNVNDLLNGRSRLQLMEDGEGTVQLLGLKEIMISSADELLDLVKHGEDSRATSANAVHDDSSRSHALLRITLYPNTSSSNSTILARLSMVDLAGSERACDTQSDNKNTRMEGAEINKSLLALKECVRALDRGASHVPFRQSKLTQLLRDSFTSESSKTVMIATVSPWSESCNHTLNTLRYADRLKEIGAA